MAGLENICQIPTKSPKLENIIRKQRNENPKRFYESLVEFGDRRASRAMKGAFLTCTPAKSGPRSLALMFIQQQEVLTSRMLSSRQSRVKNVIVFPICHASPL
jgi:hypothetical protein